MTKLICVSLGTRLRTLRSHLRIYFGIVLVVLGSVLATLGSAGAPKGGGVETYPKKWFVGLRGSSPGTFLEPKSPINCKKLDLRTTMKKIVRKVLHQRSMGTPIQQ